MKIVSFGEKINEKIVLCLGFFDGLHLGHRTIIDRAKQMAEKNSAKLALFTFDDYFSTLFKGDGLIFTLEERLKIFEDIGVDITVIAPSINEILSLSQNTFLEKIYSTYNLFGVCCGFDYTFGYKGLGNSKLLEKYFLSKGVEVSVLPPYQFKGETISSKSIKKLLKNGEISLANKLLGCNYVTSGEVISGVKLGRTMGFPTLNTLFPQNKTPLCSGVYKTLTEIDGVLYKSVTNFGNAPTFDRYNFVIETHVLNFNQNVYGKIVKIYFLDYIRGLAKFNSMEDLITQLKEDVKVHD